MEKIFNQKEKKNLRRRLRGEATNEERILWSYLAGKRIGGLKFHRQYGIGRYIVDFYCPLKKIVIEVDGKQHLMKADKKYDEIREKFMKSIGIKTLRFTNEEIRKDIEDVIERIKEDVT